MVLTSLFGELVAKPRCFVLDERMRTPESHMHCFLFFVFVVLRTEFRTLCKSGKYFPTEVQAWPQSSFNLKPEKPSLVPGFHFRPV